MRRKCLLVISTLLFAVGILFLWDQTASRLYAQQADEPKMPEVITLGADAKLGAVKFNHVKHNSGAYTIDQGKTIACIECHHTAQPKSEVEKHPPLKTAWPADRTTTLTAELFAKDPKGAGAVACRDCHARAETKPKLLDKIPEIKHEASTALITLNNMQAFHRNCAGCHAEVKKTLPATKGPVAAQCTICHKKTA